MSETKSLDEKLMDLRGKIGKVAKNQQNPFFNSQYFDINKLLEHVDPLLQEQGLLLTQPTRGDKVYSIIKDPSTGETEEAWLDMPQLSDPQKIGSCVTYFRRYTLKSLLGIQEEDDDANHASQPSTNGQPPRNAQDEEKPWLNKTEYKSDEITEDWKKVVARIEKNPDDLPKVYGHYKVNKENREELEQIAEGAKNMNAAAAQS